MNGKVKFSKRHVITLVVIAILFIAGVAQAGAKTSCMHHESQGGKNDPTWTKCMPESAWNGHGGHDGDWVFHNHPNCTGATATPKPTKTPKPTQVPPTDMPPTATQAPPTKTSPPTPTKTAPPKVETTLVVVEPEAQACPSGDCLYVDMKVYRKDQVQDAISRLQDLEEMGYLCPSCVEIRIVFDSFGETGDITWVPNALQAFEDAGYPCGIEYNE